MLIEIDAIVGWYSVDLSRTRLIHGSFDGL